MADVAAALRALEAVEAILRRRYHYPHPIFEHIEAARAALEEAPKKPSPKAEPPPAEPDYLSRVDTTTTEKPATATAQSTNVTEFYRHQIQLVEDMAATEVGWEDRNFVWAAGKDGPAPLLIGDSSLMVWGATETTTLFIEAMWVEFQNNEY